jgi:hypothetical protein
MKMKTASLAAVFVGAMLTRSADADVAPCSQRAPLIWTLSLPDASPFRWLHSLPAHRIWGTQNLAVRQDGSTKVLAVTYPNSSIDPAAKMAPVGGAGFVYPSRAALFSGCLTYEVRFASGFDFGRGGKLPGLYGGNAPSGGADAEMGFSARYMWRSGGAGEVYLYSPDKTGKYGESVGPGAWTFVPGQWQRLEEEIVVNHIGQHDGVLRVWVDGSLVVNRTDILYRVNENVLVHGLMFSTFFGGHDPSWASPKTQTALFRDFRLFGAEGQ